MFDLWTLIIACLSGGGLTLIVTLSVKLFKSIKDNKEWKQDVINSLKQFKIYMDKVDELMVKKLKDEKDEGLQSYKFTEVIAKVDELKTQINCNNEKLKSIEIDMAKIKTKLGIDED